MSSLFIANTSKQHHDFYFRRPEANQNTMIPIKAGQQVRVLNDVSKDVIDFVINQHRKYGLISGEEAGRTHGGITGLCYSVDKPVTEKQMRGAFANNDRVMKEIAKDNMATQAAATAAHIQDQLDERGIKADLDHMEVEVSEQVKPGEEAKLEPVQVEVVKPGQERRQGTRKK
jgi:L-fucose isomerase-like protein